MALDKAWISGAGAEKSCLLKLMSQPAQPYGPTDKDHVNAKSGMCEQAERSFDQPLLIVSHFLLSKAQKGLLANVPS